MDNLRQYLKTANITQREFSKRLGISHEYLSRIINGHDVPGPVLGKLIAHETGYAVSVQGVSK